METVNYPISMIEIKKHLMRTKQIAKLLHYCAGNLWYTIELEINGVSSTWKFPISTIQHETEYFLPQEEDEDEIEFEYIGLSEDLGTTPFEPEVRASELSRWLAMAYENGTLGPLN